MAGQQVLALFIEVRGLAPQPSSEVENLFLRKKESRISFNILHTFYPVSSKR